MKTILKSEELILVQGTLLLLSILCLKGVDPSWQHPAPTPLSLCIHLKGEKLHWPAFVHLVQTGQLRFMTFPAECYRTTHISVCNLAQAVAWVTLPNRSKSFLKSRYICIINDPIDFISFNVTSFLGHTCSLWSQACTWGFAVHTYASCFGCVPRYSVYLLKS